MSLEALTDDQIQKLLLSKKSILDPTSRKRTEGKHIRCDYEVKSDDGHNEFVLFTRQSTIIPTSFSAGLRWKSKTGVEIILMRCNGSDHRHGNALERTEFEAQAHIHRATERYIIAGKKAESYAEPVNSYTTLNDALGKLLKLTNTSGLDTQRNQLNLI
jgi:hypothetical protein